MASIIRDKRSGRYRICFRFGGQQYKRSLKPQNVKEARGALARVEETLNLIERGRLSVPDSVDPAVFLLSDGRMPQPVSQSVAIQLKKLITEYQSTLPVGAKEASTIAGEKIHFAHLLKHFGCIRRETRCRPDREFDSRFMEKYGEATGQDLDRSPAYAIRYV